MIKNNLLYSIKKLTLFALPLSGSMCISMIASFAAMLMVAHLGENELAAGSLAINTYITIMMTMSIFYSVGILISHHRGQEKPIDEIGELVKNGFWLAGLIAVPIGILLWNADKLLLLMGQDPLLVKLTTQYFHFAAFSIMPLMIYQVISQFYTGIGLPRLTMIASIVSMPLILMLSYAFILGNLGCPKLALAGVSCAILIVQLISCSSMLLYMYLGKYTKKYNMLGVSILPNWIICKRILSLGLPIGIQFFGEIAAMTAATYLMGHLGTTALAAGQIVSQYSLLIVVIVIGLSQALSILVSEAYGKNNYHQIKQYMTAAKILMITLMTIVIVIFASTPGYLMKLFVGNNADNVRLTHLTVVFFSLAGIFLLLDGIRNLLSSGLRGLHDSKVPMNINLMSLWLVSLPLAYLIGFPLGGGPIGLRIGFILGFVVAVIYLWNRMQKKIDFLSNTASRQLVDSEIQQVITA